MRRFEVVLKKAIIETTITIRSIPLRLYSSAKNKFKLSESMVDAIVAVNGACDAVKTIIQESCVTPVSEVYVRIANRLPSILRSSGIKAIIGIVGTPSDNRIECRFVDSEAGVVKYRTLGEMDSFSLAEYDNVGLEDVDYIWLN